MAYDPSTDAGRVRLLISDVNTSDHVFTDDEITAFLDLAADNVFSAAALALRAIAGNEAQVLKVISLMDLSTDGRATAQALRDLANEYDAKAARSGNFAIAEFAIGPFGRRERLANQARRGAI